MHYSMVSLANGKFALVNVTNNHVEVMYEEIASPVFSKVKFVRWDYGWVDNKRYQIAEFSHAEASEYVNNANAKLAEAA